MKSINPFSLQVIQEYPDHSSEEVSEIVKMVHLSGLSWRETSFAERAELFKKLAGLLRSGRNHLSELMTREMGKIIRESQAEIEKCASACCFFAENAEAMLKDEVIVSDASRSLVVFQPLGVILAVMPWNFPFWQVFRFAIPAMMAGNVAVLKHASNVPGCSLAIEDLFRKAGFPENAFRSLMIPSHMVEVVIADPLVQAVTLTGSGAAGSSVASLAGKFIKKTVLELGGSDAFIVLDDADLEKAVQVAVTARMINQGQSCIAAKRFIVVEEVAEEFTARLKEAVLKLKPGDPMDEETRIGPLARPDLVDDLEKQVNRSVESGAVLITGGRPAGLAGCFYLPAILGNVKKGMAVYNEETFGPVFAIIPVNSEAEAVETANDSEFGLGGSVWTRDTDRGERVARKIMTGAMFVNGLTKSDPRLPFGGLKKSGYGRELAGYGIKEFVNIKTIWIG